MRIAIISVPARRDVIMDSIQMLSRGMEAMGHRVDVINAWTDDGVRLPGYEYIVVAAQATSFFGGKIPEALARILKEASSLVGKKSAAFLIKSSPFTAKAFANLMRVMEKEGMLINWSEIIVNPAQAEALGKQIGA